MRCENGEAREAAVEQKTGHRKRAAPAPERHACCQRAEQTHPDEPSREVRSRERQHGVKEVDAERVMELAGSEDRVVRPKRRAIGEIADVSQVQREVAKVVGREERDVAVFHE